MKERQGIEMETRRLLDRLLRKLWIAVLGAAVGAVVFLLGTALLIAPKYQSGVMFYVNNSAVAGDSISTGDISAAKSLVDSYIVVLKTRESLQAVIEDSGADRTCGELKRMIRAEAVNSTEFFRVTVTGPDAEETARIAAAIARVLPARISGIFGGTSVKIAEAAVPEASPASPSYRLNALIGALLGLALSAGGILLGALLDPLVRCERDASESSGLPVWAAVPELATKGTDFAASEAYRLLCERLAFAMEGETHGCVIGITGALSGEGTTVTARNLARSLAQAGSRVVLIDCDLRRPAGNAPGLSEFLTGKIPLKTLLRGDEIPNAAFLPAGKPQADPARLLHSGKWNRLLESLREACDYVILDLPPAAEVSDPLAAARQCDGLLLTVRRNYGSRVALADSVRRLESLGVRLLGVVFTFAGAEGSSYGRKYDRPLCPKYPHRYTDPAGESHRF